MTREYSQEFIDRIAELAQDPRNWEPAPPEALAVGRQIADAVADRYTDDDWRYVLNALDPRRAAGTISRRPAEQRSYLLSMLDPDRRTEIERRLAEAA